MYIFQTVTPFPVDTKYSNLDLEYISILSGIMYTRRIRQIPYSGKVWGIDSFQAFGKRKFGESIGQLIGH